MILAFTTTEWTVVGIFSAIAVIIGILAFFRARLKGWATSSATWMKKKWGWKVAILALGAAGITFWLVPASRPWNWSSGGGKSADRTIPPSAKIHRADRSIPPVGAKSERVITPVLVTTSGSVAKSSDPTEESAPTEAPTEMGLEPPPVASRKFDDPTKAPPKDLNAMEEYHPSRAANMPYHQTLAPGEQLEIPNAPKTEAFWYTVEPSGVHYKEYRTNWKKRDKNNKGTPYLAKERNAPKTEPGVEEEGKGTRNCNFPAPLNSFPWRIENAGDQPITVRWYESAG